MTRYLAVAVLSLTTLSGLAEEAPSSISREDLCRQLGETAARVAESRDSGLPLPMHRAMTAQNAGGNPQLADALYAVAAMVYQHPEWTPDLARQNLTDFCQNPAAR